MVYTTFLSRLAVVWFLLVWIQYSFCQPSPQSSPGGGGTAEQISPPTNFPPGDPLADAVALCRKGNLEAGVPKFNEMLRQRPKSPDAYAGLTRCYLQRRQIDEALKTAETGLSLVDSPRVHVAHAEVLFRQGKIDEAEIEWAKAINAGFPEARAYLGLARVRNARALYKSAQAMINRAHELDDSDPDIESLWTSTLPLGQRIKFLEGALSKRTDWDAEKREDVTSELQSLREKIKGTYEPCRLLNPPQNTAEIPMVTMLGEDAMTSGWGLTVVLNGRKSSLLLDTGASGILLGRKTAERAGITKFFETKIGGIGDRGSKRGYIGIASSVQIGNLQFENCPVQILQERSVIGADGIIGTDVFIHFLVDLDFPYGTLRLGELPKRPGDDEKQLVPANDEPQKQDGSGAAENAKDSGEERTSYQVKSTLSDAYIAPQMESFTRVFLFGHDLLVPTTVGSAANKLFLLDTGAFNNAMSPAAAREVTKVHGDPHTSVKGVGGSVKNVYTANKAYLQFGHLRQENQDIVVFDLSPLSEEDGAEVSGFLGFKMLEYLDIKIDYRDALVDFTFDPKRWKF